MLVLTRQNGGAIMIETPAGLVTIKVLGIRGGQVRLGVDAPRELEVLREEIYDKIQSERNDKKDKQGLA